MSVDILFKVCSERYEEPEPTTLPVAKESFTPRSETFSRWHRSTRFDDLTINCCPHCKGEIQVV